jgi:hypothetical protein
MRTDEETFDQGNAFDFYNVTFGVTVFSNIFFLALKYIIYIIYYIYNISYIASR